MRVSVLFTLALCAPVPAQQSVTEVEALFYRAFFLDRGEGQIDPPLRLYRSFLRRAPGHRLAPIAARNTVNLLQRTRRTKQREAFTKQYAALLQGSAKPGINASFLDPKLDIRRMQERFEGESREIFRHRKALAALVGLAPGQAVADIGAGTGIFSWPFARMVGTEGKVYAVDIAPRMIEHLTRLAKNGGFAQVQPVRCTERSIELRPDSIDVAFLCDTYHHFEFPADTNRSIYRALRSGGRLVVIDFERIPGKSRQWILGHVRAGKKTVIQELESAGFRFVSEAKTKLQENYFVQFVKD